VLCDDSNSTDPKKQVGPFRSDSCELTIHERKDVMKQCKMICILLAVFAIALWAVAAPVHSHVNELKLQQVQQSAAHNGHHALDASLCNSLVCVETNSSSAFMIGTPDGRSLLFWYPTFAGTSHIAVSVDGAVYNLTYGGSSCDGTATFVNEEADAVHIADHYTLPNNISVTVTHTVETFNDSSAAVLTRTMVTNNSGASHDIGVLYEYDTMVDGDDAATLYLGPNHITVETCYTAPFTYPYWDAIPESGTLVGRGTFTGGNAVTPDALFFGQWGNLNDVCWDYTCDGENYGDSAVLYRWNAQSVANGQSRTVATYYGVGGIQSSSGDLHITVSEPSLYCSNGQVLPNPFQILVSVTDSANNTCNAVTVHMSDGSGTGGSAVITGENPQVIGNISPGNNNSATFTAQLNNPSPVGGSMTFTVQVTAGNCAENSAVFNVNVPACEEGVDNPRQSGLVTASALSQNYPNPFNAITNITFDIAQSGYATLAIYDLMGKQVATLVHGQVERGSHSVQFDASTLPSGVYIYRLTANGFTSSHKMLLMK
jgi:hypothetical protein